MVQALTANGPSRGIRPGFPMSASGLTSEASAVVVFQSGPLAFDSAMTLRFELTAARTDGGGSAFASFERRGTFSRAVSPGATVQSGATETGYTEPGATDLVADFTINGDQSVSATITGVAGHTYDWSARVWMEVTP